MVPVSVCTRPRFWAKTPTSSPSPRLATEISAQKLLGSPYTWTRCTSTIRYMPSPTSFSVLGRHRGRPADRLHGERAALDAGDAVHVFAVVGREHPAGLDQHRGRIAQIPVGESIAQAQLARGIPGPPAVFADAEIGRASCRERV